MPKIGVEMVKKKGQKSAQSKKKLDLAAAVEAAEQGEVEDLTKLNLNSEEPAATLDEAEDGHVDLNENGANMAENGEGSAVLVNYNPPEEESITEETGILCDRLRVSY